MSGPGATAPLDHFYWSIRRISEQLDVLIEVVSSGLLVVLILLAAAEIVSRELFNYSLFWAFEINLLAGNWMYFVGIALVYHRGRDITLDYLFDKLHPESRRRALLAITLVTLAVLLVLLWYSVEIVRLQSEAKTTGLGIPNHYYSLPVLIGTAVMIIYTLRHALAILLRIADDPGVRL